MLQNPVKLRWLERTFKEIMERYPHVLLAVADEQGRPVFHSHSTNLPMLEKLNTVNHDKNVIDFHQHKQRVALAQLQKVGDGQVPPSAAAT